MTKVPDLFEQAARLTQGAGPGPFRTVPLRMMKSVAQEFHSSIPPPSLRRRARTFWMDRLRVVLPGNVSMCLNRCAILGEDLTRLRLTRLKTGPTFFDVGVRSGDSSALATAPLGSTGKVHPVEPAPRTFALLERKRVARRNLETHRPLFLPEAGDAIDAGPERTRDILSARAVRGDRPSCVQAGAYVPYEHSVCGADPEILAVRAEEP